MSSRGAVVENGHVTTEDYRIVKIVEDAKVLKGTTNKQHGLPDYAHSKNSKYIKENPDGSFREIRVYNAKGFPIFEVGYHAEKSLTGNRHEKVLHVHWFDSNFNRIMGGIVSETSNREIYLQVKKYLEAYGLL
ncbi:MAG: hypothetical protein J5876_04910 [Lachnospiraceae bacterium]|nr:hypothetical protein [Lachnospiraceae bacterium]